MIRGLTTRQRCAAPALVGVLLAALLVPADQTPGQQKVVGAPPDPTAPTPLSTLQPVVKVYNFDEAQATTDELPIPFFRYAPVREGFPPFGSMKLTNQIACHGTGSLMFELGGGSMAARIPVSVINVLPFADYVVTVNVRTDGLRHARARLVAWLHDTNGRIIETSRVFSRLAETNGQWDSLRVEIEGTFADAGDLVFELQVVQPAQFEPPPPPNAQPAAQPSLSDVAGRVYFDDVTVSHLPRVSLTMQQPSNMTRLPDAPQLLVQVSELTSEPITARVRVIDHSGKLLFDTSFPAPRGRQVHSVTVPLGTCGWYRAMLDISSTSRLSRREVLDFVVLPARDRRPAMDHRQFGIALPPESSQDLPLIPAAIAAIQSGSAIVPMWVAEGPVVEPAGDRRHLIEQLLHMGVDLTFSLDVVPTTLASNAGVDNTKVLQVLLQPARTWRPYLDDLLVNFGMEVSRWQVGSTGTDASRTAGLSDAVARVATSFSEFIPKPLVFIPHAIEEASAKGEGLPGYALSVPYQIAPGAIPAYAAEWLKQPGQTYAALETAPAETSNPGQRIADLMLRGLYGWRAGFPLMVIRVPWNSSTVGRAGLVPDPVFPAWRTLAEQLGGRTFASELPAPDGQHCWIARGSTATDAAMIAWSDRVGSGASDTLVAQLGNGPVEVIDAFGNAATVMPVAGLHHIALSETPVFIHQMNLELVQFRSGVAIEPAFIPAVAKLHEHELVLHNPWDVTVNGSIRVIVDDQWQMTPEVQQFVIPARGETRLPLGIIPQRNILAGRKQVQMQIELNADQHYDLEIAADLELGLENISLAASWSVVRNPQTGVDDLVVTEVVTNRGSVPMILELYLLANDIGQKRRTIPMLSAGETQVRSFRVANGVALLSGTEIRVGVADRDGLTRLNYALAIPDRNQPRLQAGAPEVRQLAP